MEEKTKTHVLTVAKMSANPTVDDNSPPTHIYTNLPASVGSHGDQ